MSVFSDDEGILLTRVQKARKNYQEAMNFLVNDYKSAAALMSRYYPLAVLSKASWHAWEAGQVKNADEVSRTAARIMPVFLQSVMQSRYYETGSGFSSLQDIRQKDWDRLKEITSDAVRRYLRLIENRAVIAVKEGLVREEDFAVYRDALFSELFLSPATEISLEKDRTLFNAVFTGDEDLAESVFHTDEKTLMQQLYAFAGVCVTAIDELVSDTRSLNEKIRAEVDALMSQKPQLTRQLASDEVIAKGGWRPRLESLRQRADSYDMFSVEMNTLLSTETCKCFSASAGSIDDVISDGRFTAVIYPFLRFADRFYCFTGSMFFPSTVYAIRAAIHRSGTMQKVGEKLDKISDHFILYLFRQSDIEDVYTYKGYKADVVLLSSLRHIDCFEYPQLWTTRLERRKSERKRTAQLGHVLLFVDPDSDVPLTDLGESSFMISLSALADVTVSDEKMKAFYSRFFDIQHREDYPEVESYEEAFSEDEILPDDSSYDSPLDEVPVQVLLDDESEYDRTDDDEKARIIESRFDQEDRLPSDVNEDQACSRSYADLSGYELPEALKNEEVVEELDDLETDDFSSDEADELDDEEDDSFLFEEDDLDEPEDEAEPDFEDDEAGIEQDSGLDEDEEYDESQPVSDECYIPEDDPDQLKLFDDDGSPAQNLPDDELAALDKLETESDELYILDKEPTEAAEETQTEEVQSEEVQSEEVQSDEVQSDEVQSDEVQSDEVQSDEVQSDELKADELKADELKAEPAAKADELPLSSEEEDEEDGDFEAFDQSLAEKEEAELDSIPHDSSVLDESLPDISPEQAEEEEEGLVSEESEERQEAEEEEEDFASSLEAEMKDPDVIADSSPDYNMETSSSSSEKELPEMLGEIRRRLDSPLAGFEELTRQADSQTLSALDSAIRKAVTASRTEQKDKMLVIPSCHLSLIVSAFDRLDSLRKMEVRNNAGTQMYARGLSDWSFVLLYYDSSELLRSLYCEELTPDSFSHSDWKIVSVLGEELKKNLR